MLYSFARIGAVVAMKVEDVFRDALPERCIGEGSAALPQKLDRLARAGEFATRGRL
jgi:hypothetical protein